MPDLPGLYLWLRRDRPGPDGRATDTVLYAGKATSLRKRLHGYSSTKYTREDPVLRALFDRVVAPGLNDRDLRAVIEGRLSPGIAQMWVRDHVVFGWAATGEMPLGIAEPALIATVAPRFNPAGGGWTQYESTGHEHHDLTLPIEP